MKTFSNLLGEFSISNIGNIYMGYRFGKLLKTDFKDWEAYKHGLIDETGTIVKQPSTPEEKRTLGQIETLVRKIKRTLIKFVGNKKFLFTMMALYLMKNESVIENEKSIRESINKSLTKNEKRDMISILTVIESEKMKFEEGEL